MGRWIEQVRAQTSEPQGDELTKLTEGAFVGFVSASGGVFQENQPPHGTGTKPAPPVAGDLETGIRFARSEAELDRLVEDVQAGFEDGQLSQAQAERLTWLAVEVARQHDAGLVNIPASAFLEVA